MTELEINPTTTVAEHIAQVSAKTAEETIAVLAEENLNLRRRIQETLEICGSGFINLAGFGDPGFTGLAVLIDDVKDALTDGEGPVITKVFYDGYLEMLETNRKLREEFQLGLGNITRITVVSTKYGRAHEAWDYHGVELHIQDSGRTLKVFPKREPELGPEISE